MPCYLCYDIRGIQSFIFRIPKLKYIIGGSALIDQFDRETMHKFNSKEYPAQKNELLFAGGGKGTFLCNSKNEAEELRDNIIKEAHDIGLDIRFGINEDYEKASKGAIDLYPFIPNHLDGAPCPSSGLYPVHQGEQVHPIVKKRLFDFTGSSDDEKKMFRHFENRLLSSQLNGIHNELIDTFPLELKDATFFHNVTTDPEDPENDADGRIGAKALGNRNRWAVICMDGNDMGSQLQYKLEELNNNKIEANTMATWIQAMSTAIDKCSTEATKAGIAEVVNKWWYSKDKCSQVLPIRPIIVGGDDVTVLCHCAYAMDFVKAVCKKFEEVAIEQNDYYLKNDLHMSIWPATGGKITISAGVLFCPVSLPLHSAIEYTEALLASAKTRGRKVKKQKVEAGADSHMPTPASIDWEDFTGSVLTTPAAYRQRELFFEENGKSIKLISRPFTMEEFQELDKDKELLRNIPASTIHKVLPAMCRPLNDRLAFAASLAKNHWLLARAIIPKNFDVPGTKVKGAEKFQWYEDQADNTISTRLIDALQLLEEENRQKKETVNE